MLRLASYDIVFQEVPAEVTLALNLSGCPHLCEGCHSPHLREETGEPLDEELLGGLLQSYGSAVTCVCFMGGDADPQELLKWAAFVRKQSGGRLKTAWYSGRETLPETWESPFFDYIKLGPYIRHLGGLSSPSTNQRFYKNDCGRMIDLTGLFHTDG